jgi:hypothetical protein
VQECFHGGTVIDAHHQHEHGYRPVGLDFRTQFSEQPAFNIFVASAETSGSGRGKRGQADLRKRRMTGAP